MRDLGWAVDGARSVGGARLLALLLAASAPACAGKSAGTGSDAAVSSEQFAGQLADAFCDNIAGCCQAAAITFDLATCKANASAFYQGQLRQILALKISYVASEAAQCVALYASAVKSCTSPDNWFGANTACRRVLVATLPVGAPCRDSVECAPVAGSSVACDGDTSRTCVAKPKLTLGAPCSDTCTAGQDCSNAGTSAPSPGSASTPGFCYVDDGLYCSPTNTCQTLLAVGQPCADGDRCVAGAFCTGAACTAIDTCTDDSNCGGLFCQIRADGTQACGANTLASPFNCAGTIGAGAD